ncbi:MAG: NAD-dependent epimerase/dehydratase family protein [Elusimicrobia bacterium]|nr:NAD-dependent epimerase/dehydratase family protein [Elusimicrobiota bacterium]MBU2615122.1 NAD-dependent epimerase/dehydratase family protein [Elusimicrobiota bacterium]
MMNTRTIEIVKNDCSQILTQKHVKTLEKLKNEKIFITGGTGFIGTWLAELIAFLNDNYRFNTNMVLMSKNAFSFSSKVPHLTTRKDIVLIEKDIRDFFELPDDVSYIIHAAADPDNRKHSSEPIKTMEVISKGTDSILSAATRLSNIKSILNISSGLIYGGQPFDLERISESFHGGPDCDSIVSIYSEAKRYTETLCTAYRNQFKLPILTARPFAFLGPYQLIDKPWAINNFIRDSLLGGPIRILGNENTVRSYMYASDMAFWFLSILSNGKAGLAYNVGSPNSITLKNLAEKISNNFPNKIKIVSELPPNKNADKSRFVPDTTLANEFLGLKETVDIEDALRRTITWYHEFLK